MIYNGSSKNSVEDVTTEDAETPSAARKAADEDCALRRKPPLILGTTKDGWNCCGWKVQRQSFDSLLPCRTKCGSVYSVVPAPTKIFEVPNLFVYLTQSPLSSQSDSKIQTSRTLRTWREFHSGVLQLLRVVLLGRGVALPPLTRRAVRREILSGGGQAG